jgi:hypothetical protein
LIPQRIREGAAAGLLLLFKHLQASRAGMNGNWLFRQFSNAGYTDCY